MSNSNVDRAAPCWLCGSDAEVDPQYKSVSLYRCPNCRFLFAPERSADELHDIYTDEYFEEYQGGTYDAEIPQRRFEAKRRLKWMKPWVRSGRLFEVGAVSGIFLDEARSHGFTEKVFGIEPAEGEAVRAREQLDVDVVSGFIETADIPPEPFDAICMWHVLEHIPDPLPSMKRLREVIKDDGRVFIEIPNIESPLAIEMGVGWPYLEPKNHVGFYTRENLAELFGQAGFEIEATTSVSMRSYQRPALALRPGSILGRVTDSVHIGAISGLPHAFKHDLLRAVARPV